MDDFLVIGGGIAGLSAAARLSRLGRVCLVEAEPVTGYHTSGRSAAMFEENYGSGSTLALNRASGDHHRTANGGYLTPRGLLVLAAPGDDDVFARDLDALSLDGISIAEARAKVPILDPQAIGRAGYHDAAWDIDTDRLMQDFARDLRRNGGRIKTRSPVTGFQRRDGKWTVTAGNEDFVAKIMVNAAGAWADKVAELAGVASLGITPFRRSMARIPAPGGHDVTGWPMVMGAGEAWYAKPDAGKLLVSPADRDPIEPQDAWPDDMVLAEGLARYEAFVTEPVTRLETSWAGLRSFSPDGELVIGPDPEVPDFVWCAGQGGYGFQTSPAASRLLADLVAGATPVLDAKTVAALSPARFHA